MPHARAIISALVRPEDSSGTAGVVGDGLGGAVGWDEVVELVADELGGVVLALVLSLAALFLLLLSRSLTLLMSDVTADDSVGAEDQGRVAAVDVEGFAITSVAYSAPPFS